MIYSLPIKDIDNVLYASKELKFGGVMINDSTNFRVDYIPFGGFKKSGSGRERHKFVLSEMTEIKLTYNYKRGYKDEGKG
ncbi:MAG: aldehyde dehydrogenase family protein [Candidatus Stahlbacteria bacterium]|nr:MAG: aldehyde dehydrogenase family protein [Candidatus Stahlbacteria bacterium]